MALGVVANCFRLGEFLSKLARPGSSRHRPTTGKTTRKACLDQGRADLWRRNASSPRESSLTRSSSIESVVGNLAARLLLDSAEGIKRFAGRPFEQAQRGEFRSGASDGSANGLALTGLWMSAKPGPGSGDRTFAYFQRERRSRNAARLASNVSS
jgi:hypothetical protein